MITMLALYRRPDGGPEAQQTFERRYAEEPGLAWLSMINEGNFGNFYKEIRLIPEWTAAWNQWVSRRTANCWRAAVRMARSACGTSKI